MSATQEVSDPLVARLHAAEAQTAEQINGIDLEQPVDVDQVLGADRDPGPEPPYVCEEIDTKKADAATDAKPLTRIFHANRPESAFRVRMRAGWLAGVQS
jgi:hypothetical protein